MGGDPRRLLSYFAEATRSCHNHRLDLLAMTTASTTSSERSDRESGGLMRAMLLSASIAVACAPAVAAPPLVVDDASTLQPGQCQAETEQRRYGNRQERDFSPACNFIFDTEIGIGFSRVLPDDARHVDAVVYQFKKVAALPHAPGWSAGLGMSSARATGGQRGARQDAATLLVSRTIERDGGAIALHVNLGHISSRDPATATRSARFFRGAAAEWNVTPRWTLVGEVFGQRGLPQTRQVGVRAWLLPDYVQLTTSVGQARGLGRDGRWFSLGVRLETAALLQ